MSFSPFSVLHVPSVHYVLYSREFVFCSYIGKKKNEAEVPTLYLFELKDEKNCEKWEELVRGRIERSRAWTLNKTNKPINDKSWSRVFFLLCPILYVLRNFFVFFLTPKKYGSVWRASFFGTGKIIFWSTLFDRYRISAIHFVRRYQLEFWPNSRITVYWLNL